EVRVSARVPLGLEHGEGDGQREQEDGIEAGEAGAPEVALDQRRGPTGVVICKNVAGEQEEEDDKDIAAVDDRIEKPHVRRGEVEEHDGERKQGADAGERRQIRSARGGARLRYGWGWSDGGLQGGVHWIQV